MAFYESSLNDSVGLRDNFLRIACESGNSTDTSYLHGLNRPTRAQQKIVQLYD